MSRLTVITIIMAIPTMVFSFYGMNTAHLPVPDTWFPTLISVMVTVAVASFLFRNKNK